MSRRSAPSTTTYSSEGSSTELATNAERAAGEVESAHPAVTVDQPVGVAPDPVERHRDDGHASAVLHRDDQPVAVPDRRADTGERLAVVVELLGEHGDLAGRAVDDGDPGVAVADALDVAQAGDALAVGLPRQAAVGRVGRGELARLERVGVVGIGGERSRDVDDPDVVVRLEVEVGLAGGRRGEPGAVRRPGRRVVVESVAGHLLRGGAAVDRDDEQLRRAVDGPAVAVQPREQPVDLARRAGRVVVAVGVARIAYAGREREVVAVGRPDQPLEAFVAGRERHRLARGVDRDDVERDRLLVVLATGRPTRRDRRGCS